MGGIAGSVAPVFRGAYSADATYDFYHSVTYENKLYFCKQDATAGKTPSGATDDYWFLSIDGTFTDANTLNGFTAQQVGESGARNLIPYPYRDGTPYTQYGITWEVDENGWVYPYGTATANSAYFLQRFFDNLVDGETYTISGCPAGGGTDSWLFRVADDTNTTNIMASDYGDGKTFTYTKDSGEVRLYLRIKSGVTIEKGDIVFKPMLERGSVKHNHTRYHLGGAEDALTLTGLTPSDVGASGVRNLIVYPYYIAFPSTKNGITAIDNGDGTITLDGKATAKTDFYLRHRMSYDKNPLILPPGTYTFYGENIGKTEYGVYSQLGGTNPSTGGWVELATDYGGGVTFTTTEEMQTGVTLIVAEGTVCDNLVVKLMVERGAIAHGFVPYHYLGAKHAFKADDANAVGGYSESELAKSEDLANYMPTDGSVPLTGTSFWTNGGLGGIYTDENTIMLRSLSSAKDTNNFRGLIIKNANGDTPASIILRDRASGTNKDYTVLHNGNSVPVAMGDTAPTDTTAMWYDTANNTWKRYVDGAWTA